MTSLFSKGKLKNSNATDQMNSEWKTDLFSYSGVHFHFLIISRLKPNSNIREKFFLFKFAFVNLFEFAQSCVYIVVHLLEFGNLCSYVIPDSKAEDVFNTLELKCSLYVETRGKELVCV